MRGKEKLLKLKGSVGTRATGYQLAVSAVALEIRRAF